MGPHHEKKIKHLIYPTLTFSALTTRLFSNLKQRVTTGGPTKICLGWEVRDPCPLAHESSCEKGTGMT